MTHKKITSNTPFALYFWFFQVVIVLGLASVAVWLSLVPKVPIFTIANVYIPALNRQNSTHLPFESVHNTSLIFGIRISNPNKGIGVHYDDIRVSASHSLGVIGAKSLPAFRQGHGKTGFWDVLIDAEHRFWRGIATGNVELRMAVETAVKYQIFRWETEKHRLDLEAFLMICPNGTVSGDKNIKRRRQSS